MNSSGTAYNLSPSSDRIQLADALRGFALAGICLVHFMEQYLGDMPPPGMEAYARHSALDGLIDVLGFALIRGKGFALFSFMFGLSFALQMIRAAKRDPEADFRPRFAWRLIVLLLIALPHAMIYQGDILSVYALLGLPLVLFYRVPDRWVVIIAFILVLGTPRIMLQLAAPRVPERSAIEQKTQEQRATHHYQALKNGPVSEVIRVHTLEGLWLKMSFQFGTFARGYQTFAYFLLGLWVGRRRIFENTDEHLYLIRKVYKRCGWLTLGIPVAVVVLAIAGSLLAGNAKGSPASPIDRGWGTVIGLSLYDSWNFIMTLFIIAAFIMLWRKPKWQSRLMFFAPAGRMALTNYVLQSIMGGLFFHCYGLALLGDVGNSFSLPLGIAVFALQGWGSKAWLARFHYGPLEWIWRWMTWLKRPPFVKLVKPMAA